MSVFSPTPFERSPSRLSPRKNPVSVTPTASSENWNWNFGFRTTSKTLQAPPESSNPPLDLTRKNPVSVRGSALEWHGLKALPPSLKESSITSREAGFKRLSDFAPSLLEARFALSPSLPRAFTPSLEWLSSSDEGDLNPTSQESALKGPSDFASSLLGASSLSLKGSNSPMISREAALKGYSSLPKAESVPSPFLSPD